MKLGKRHATRPFITHSKLTQVTGGTDMGQNGHMHPNVITLKA